MCPIGTAPAAVERTITGLLLLLLDNFAIESESEEQLSISPTLVGWSRSASQKMVPRAESSMILPLGAHSVAGVGMDFGPAPCWLGAAGSGSTIEHRRSTVMGSRELVGRTADVMRAKPKYSPDLFAEKTRKTSSAVCDAVSQASKLLQSTTYVVRVTQKFLVVGLRRPNTGAGAYLKILKG